jgi:hypothetical protein
LIFAGGVIVVPFLRLAGGATALALVAATAPPPVDPLLADAAAARAFDYGALRERLGDEQLKALSQEVQASVSARLAATPGACETEAEAYVLAGLLSAMQTSDPATWRADWTAANAQRDRLYALVAKVLNGEDVGLPEYAGARAAALTALETTDSRHRELYARVAKDQALRHTTHEVWALPKGPLRDMVQRPFTARLCGVDADNTAWLKAEWRASGWFTAARDGQAASGDAWLLLQHADRDPDFQRAVLPILARETGLQGRINYAYLSDRVATNAKQPQTFGTQGRCVGPGAWEPNPVTEPEGLEARRAEIGLGSIAEYKAQFKTVCANFQP